MWLQIYGLGLEVREGVVPRLAPANLIRVSYVAQIDERTERSKARAHLAVERVTDKRLSGILTTSLCQLGEALATVNLKHRGGHARAGYW